MIVYIVKNGNVAVGIKYQIVLKVAFPIDELGYLCENMLFC